MQGLKRLEYLVLLYALLSALIEGTAAVNYNDCIHGLKENNQTLSGGLDNNGNPVPIGDATAISYALCKSACGSSQEPFSWANFSQKFSAWLLPFLALISQLPFGAKHRLDSLMSVFLTVGSPTLAGYSLVITVLNTRWITLGFEAVDYPNAQHAVRVLSNLQQTPLRISAEDSFLSSLVVLPQNDAWWLELADNLDYPRTWPVSALTSIAWVILAYIFAVVDSLANVSDNMNSNGEGIGSVWLWSIPIVIGWLQLSPKCNYFRLHRAMKHANMFAYVAGENGAVRASTISDDRAMSINALVNDELTSADEDRSPPVYNYSRVLPWSHSAEEVLLAYRLASRKAAQHVPIDPTVEWREGERDMPIHPDNRIGPREAVHMYCHVPDYVVRSRWPSGVFRRMITASLIALAMQWGSTGAGLVVAWHTPTAGLGCRAGSFILYGAISTLIWIMLVTSSIISHYARYRRLTISTTLLTQFTDLLCWSGKLLAILNSTWIVLACIFQFSNVFDTCFCNSNALGSEDAFYTIILNAQEIVGIRSAWVGGFTMASVSAIAFIIFVHLMADPSN